METNDHKTEAGAQIGKEAPAQDALEAKTRANQALGDVRTVVREFIDDLENIPAEVIKELHDLFNAFHAKATTAVSEAPVE